VNIPNFYDRHFFESRVPQIDIIFYFGYIIDIGIFNSAYHSAHYVICLRYCNALFSDLFRILYNGHGPTWSIYTQASAHNKDRKNPVACWKLSYKFILGNQCRGVVIMVDPITGAILGGVVYVANQAAQSISNVLNNSQIQNTINNAVNSVVQNSGVQNIVGTGVQTVSDKVWKGVQNYWHRRKS